MRRAPALSARSVVVAIAVCASVAVLRAQSLRWGATDEEVSLVLPGDELVPHADLRVTRAVTVDAAVAGVWPWIAQLGQGRGGFYSYDFLENLVGCDIHSADRIVAEWQSIEVGDEVNLYPGGGLVVAGMKAGRALVLRGGMPMARTPSPYDFTWASCSIVSWMERLGYWCASVTDTPVVGPASWWSLSSSSASS